MKLTWTWLPLMVLLQTALAAKYEVSVQTSDRSRAGTCANVYITVIGSKGRTAEHKLGTSEDNFERGSLDKFNFVDPIDVGAFEGIEVRRDGSGTWMMDNVTVTYNNIKTVYRYGDWVLGKARTPLSIASCGAAN